MSRDSDHSSVLSWLDTLDPLPRSTSPDAHNSEQRRGRRGRHDSFDMETSAARTPLPPKRKRRRVAADSVADDHVEDTPRATSMCPTPSFATRSVAASSGRSVSPQRSRSPEKKINVMRSAPQPIELQQFHERKEEIPDELKTIFKTIDSRLSRGISVISNEHKVNSSPRPTR